MTRLWAKMGVTPEAQFLYAVDRHAGKQFNLVIEVDADEGWLVRFTEDASGMIITDDKGNAVTERLDRLNLRIDVDPRTLRLGPGAERREWNPEDTADEVDDPGKLAGHD